MLAYRPRYDPNGARTPSLALGFTLVELLVVVGIIAALLAILLPSLKRARSAAQSAKCLANLHGLSSASMVYAAEDRHENAVPVHPKIVGFYVWVGEAEFGGVREWGGKSGRGGPHNDTTDPLSSHWGTANGMGPATRPLNGVIYKNLSEDAANDPGPDQNNWLRDTQAELELFRCPSDTGFTAHQHTLWKESGLTGFDHFGNSYGVTPVAGPAFKQCTTSLGVFLHAVSRIPSPGQSILYLESCATHTPIHHAYAAAFCGDSHGMTQYISAPEVNPGWHGKDWMSNTSFADGHARSLDMSELYLPPPLLPRYPLKNGERSSQKEWECFILRGPGWQADVLPAPPTPWPPDCD